MNSSFRIRLLSWDDATEQGPVFEEAGIPHVCMVMDLQVNARS